MKLGKKIVAILMVILTIAMLVPFSVFATEEKKLQANSGANIVVDNDFSAIVMNEIENSDDGYFGIDDVTIVNKLAVVNAILPNNCKIVVAIYDESGMKMLGSGMTESDENVREYTINLDIVSMPSYFLVKVFAISQANQAIVESFVCRDYTKAFEAFFAKTTDDFDEKYVMNFDESKNNNFAVLNDGTIRVESTNTKNIITKADEENDTYIIDAAESVVKNLKHGDIIYIKTGEESNEYMIIAVDSIAVNKNRVTINSSEENMADVFEYIKLDTSGGVKESDLKDVKLGNALTLVEDTGSTYRAKKRDIDYNESDSASIETKIEYETDTTPKVTVSGAFSFTFTIEIKLYYDKKLFKEDWFDYRFVHKEEVGFTGEISGKLELEKDDVKIEVPAIVLGPFSVSVFAYPVLEVSLKCELILMFMSESVQTYNPYDGEKKHQDQSKSFDADLNGALEIKFGIGVGVKAKATVIAIELSVEAYLKFDGDSGGLKDLLTEYHFCDICTEGILWLGVEGKLGVNIEITKKLKWNIVEGKVNIDVELCDFHISIYDGDLDIGEGKCKNRWYRADFTVTSNSSPVKGVKIDLDGGHADNDGDKKLTDKYAITNNEGETFAYFDNGDYNLTITADGYKTTTKKIKINNDSEFYYITLVKENEEPDNPDNPDDPDDPDDPPVIPGKISWSYNSGTRTLTISGSGDMEDYWSYSDAPWHQYYMEIENVKMSEGITHIGDYAFAQCRSLSNITIPSTVKSIGEGAFYGCQSLPKIVIGDKVETIGDYAFYYCATASELSIGKKVKTIGAYAFAQCVALTSVTVPASVTSIDNYAFGWDKNIIKISILNPSCSIYNSSDVIPTSAIIGGYTGSTAQAHANRYGHTFSKIVLMSRNADYGIATAASVDYNAKKYTAQSGNTINGEYYVLLVLNNSLNGNDFTTDQLLYIDQVTADTSGKVSFTYIPRTSENSKVYIIGNFADGSSVKEVSAERIYDTENCSCNCHKNGIAKFFFKLILFFQKIFRTNKECKCGMPHY